MFRLEKMVELYIVRDQEDANVFEIGIDGFKGFEGVAGREIIATAEVWEPLSAYSGFRRLLFNSPNCFFTRDRKKFYCKEELIKDAFEQITAMFPITADVEITMPVSIVSNKMLKNIGNKHLFTNLLIASMVSQVCFEQNIDSFPNLKTLKVHGKTSIPELPNLEGLDCSYNRIKELPNLPNLKFLNCQGTKITQSPESCTTVIGLKRDKRSAKVE